MSFASAIQCLETSALVTQKNTHIGGQFGWILLTFRAGHEEGNVEESDGF
jgi:hypothetical protein